MSESTTISVLYASTVSDSEREVETGEIALSFSWGDIDIILLTFVLTTWPELKICLHLATKKAGSAVFLKISRILLL